MVLLLNINILLLIKKFIKNFKNYEIFFWKTWINVTLSETLAEMPERANLPKQMYCIRLANLPLNPMSLRDLEGIPNQCRITLNNSKCLLYDSLEDADNRMDTEEYLIFSTIENLKQLFKCDTWFADRTFKTTPAIFCQTFFILGSVHQVGDNHKPQTIGLLFMHALLQSKRQWSYIVESLM